MESFSNLENILIDKHNNSFLLPLTNIWNIQFHLFAELNENCRLAIKPPYLQTSNCTKYKEHNGNTVTVGMSLV